MKVPVAAITALALVLSVTSGFQLADSWYDEQRVACAFILALIASAGLRGDRSSLSRSPAWIPSWLLLGVVLLGAASTITSAERLPALGEWAVLMLFAATLLSLARNRALAQASALWCAGLVAGGYSFAVINCYAAAWLLQVPLGVDTFIVGFANPRFAGQLQSLTLPLLPLLWSTVAARWRIGVTMVASLWWMCLIGSGSRTAWLALACAGMVALGLGPAGRAWCRKQLHWGLIGAVLFIVLFVVLPDLMGRAAVLEEGRLLDKGSVDARFELWRLALEMARAHPWLGVGPGHFAYTLNPWGAHPHNFWLQLAAEWGVPAALLAGSLAVALFVQTIRVARLQRCASSALIAVTAACALATWGVGTQLDGYMVVPTSQLMSALVIGFSLAVVRAYPLRSMNASAESASATPAGAAERSGLMAMLAGAILAVGIVLSSSYGKPGERERAWRAENPLGAAAWPRFWQMGWIGPEQDPTARLPSRR